VHREKLETAEIERRIVDLNGWSEDAGKLTKRFEFANFAESLAFVNKVGEIAEDLDHHPDVSFGWGYAVIDTTTHDRGGVTDFDLALAGSIDKIS
jgi:4a-hydroxytetrahydrobiopterin dehydratase